MRIIAALSKSLFSTDRTKWFVFFFFFAFVCHLRSMETSHELHPNSMLFMWHFRLVQSCCVVCVCMTKALFHLVFSAFSHNTFILIDAHKYCSDGRKNIYRSDSDINKKLWNASLFFFLSFCYVVKATARLWNRSRNSDYAYKFIGFSLSADSILLYFHALYVCGFTDIKKLQYTFSLLCLL